MHPSFEFVPNEIQQSIRTDRLLLRCPTPDDGQTYYDAAQNSLPELRPWFDMRQEETLSGCEGRMRYAQARFLARESFEFLIFQPNSPQLLGRVGLYAANWKTPSFEMGYWLRTAAYGQGIMTEAVTALTHFALYSLHANRVAIFCNEKNIRSAAVARRAGYPLEGVLHNDGRHYLTGELYNACVFACTPQTFAPEAAT